MVPYLRFLALWAALGFFPHPAWPDDPESGPSGGTVGAPPESGFYTTVCPPRLSNATSISSEQLQGVLIFEIGDINWGAPRPATNSAATDGGIGPAGMQPRGR